MLKPLLNEVQCEATMPTVVDRPIQQALHQVLAPLCEPTFCYGFGPGRGAHLIP